MDRRVSRLVGTSPSSAAARRSARCLQSSSLSAAPLLSRQPFLGVFLFSCVPGGADCLRGVECFNQERLQPLMCHVVSSAEPCGKSRPSPRVALLNIVLQSLTTSLMTALTLRAVVFVNRGWWGGGNDSLVTPDVCFPEQTAAARLLSASSQRYSLHYWKDPSQQPPPPSLRLDWLVFLTILKCGDVSSHDKKNKNNGSACLKRGAIGAIRLAGTTPKLGCRVLGIAMLARNESGLRSGDSNFDFFLLFRVDRGELSPKVSVLGEQGEERRGWEQSSLQGCSGFICCAWNFPPNWFWCCYVPVHWVRFRSWCGTQLLGDTLPAVSCKERGFAIKVDEAEQITFRMAKEKINVYMFTYVLYVHIYCIRPVKLYIF